MTVKLRVDDPVAASVEAIKEAARQAATSNQTSLANVGGGQVLVTFLRDYGGYKGRSADARARCCISPSHRQCSFLTTALRSRPVIRSLRIKCPAPSAAIRNGSSGSVRCLWMRSHRTRSPSS